MSGGTSAAASRSKNEEKSPVLTRAHVNKGSAWQLPMLGEQGKWIPRRSEDTSEDSEDDDTRQSLDGQPVGDVPAAKDSGPERPEDKALAAALECSAGTNHGLFSGYVIRVKGTTVSVLYGRNEVAQVNRPSRGAYAKVRFGDAVVLARRVRFISGKAAKVTYGFAALKKEEKFVPTAEKMVAMKAVMLVVAGDGADGVAVLPALGIKVSVTAANAEELCKLSNLEAAAGGLCGERGGAVGGSGAGCLPVGSSFFFFPTFQGGKVLLERVCPFGISIAEAGSATAVPATSVDLCTGFLLPDSRVQDLAGQHLQVEPCPLLMSRGTPLPMAWVRMVCTRCWWRKVIPDRTSCTTNVLRKRWLKLKQFEMDEWPRRVIVVSSCLEHANAWSSLRLRISRSTRRG